MAQPPQPPPQPRARGRAANTWLILGREPLLSAAELFSVLQIPLDESNAYNYHPPILRLSLREATEERRNNHPAEPNRLIKQLGGTVKIGKEIASGITEENLLGRMMEELRKIDGKIHFGISWYGSAGIGAIPATSAGRHELPQPAATIEHWGKEIKRRLQAEGRSARYVFKDEPVLSSVTVEQNKLVDKGREFLACPAVGANGRSPLQQDARYDLAITSAVQPFKEFSARDYNRPGRDATSGMLPPKLALMMLNLAVRSHSSFDILHSSFSILDPFCGSGTILTEAMLLGYKNLIGADISDKAIADTKRNLEWSFNRLQATSYQLPVNISQADVTTLSKNLPPASVDAIVTEPFLGPPLKGRETIEQVKKTALELNHLYFQSFKEFKKILRPGGVVVFIFPRFLVKNEWITISNRVVPDIKKLGFTVEPLLPKEIHAEQFVLYHRERQRVGREIWRFRLDKSCF